MDIGKLRHRVSIIEISQGQPDGIGGYLNDKNTVATIWAQVTNVTGRRDNEGQSVYNRKQIEAVIRSDAYAVTTKNLLDWESEEYTIDSVVEDAKKDFTTIQAWA